VVGELVQLLTTEAVSSDPALPTEVAPVVLPAPVASEATLVAPEVLASALELSEPLVLFEPLVVLFEPLVVSPELPTPPVASELLAVAVVELVLVLPVVDPEPLDPALSIASCMAA